MLPAAGQEPDDKLRLGAQFEFLAREGVMVGVSVNLGMWVII